MIVLARATGLKGKVNLPIVLNLFLLLGTINAKSEEPQVLSCVVNSPARLFLVAGDLSHEESF